ncbi:MAG: fibronectin type III domain-containing protein [Jatrophihabitantaceae bacterium]
MGRTRTAWRRSTTGPRRLGDALSRTQALALVSVLAVTVAGIAVAAELVSPNRARTFDLIHGSLFLADDRAPVAVDLATGKPTVRLLGAGSQVNASSTSELTVTPLASGTLLLNSQTGEFNLVDGTGFVVKTTAGGVPLPKQAGAGTAMAVAAGSGAYVVRTGQSSTSVFLVNAATVQSATRAKAKISPRASAVLNQPSSVTPGSAVAANDDLWLLTGSQDAQTLRQLSVPAGSETGAQLTGADRASVTGPAALAALPGGSGPDGVVLASAGQLQVFAGNGASHTLPVTGLSGVDQILAATGSQSTAAFLYHSGAGWTVLSASSTSRTADIHRVSTIPAASSLAQPAMSGGQLYTMDRARSGALWQLGLDGTGKPLAGLPSYPISKDAAGKPIEVAAFSDAQLIAERSRVLFNSPNHVLALAVFTDGSHRPTVIDKSSAADLNAAGGASAIANQHNSTVKRNLPKQQQQQPPKAVTPTAPAINNRISCKTTTATPHVPTITTATSASRSVLLAWNYPLLDSQDCSPSTYQVSVRTLTDGSPSAPGQLTVQGQQGVNITGLYPSTRYQLTVTAYLNGRGTSSGQVVVTTGPEGPAAPTAVTAVADNTGSWTVSWHACGSVKSGCVPAANWSVIPRFCDGLGLSGPLAPIPVVGDPTLSQFSAPFAGGSTLLGRGISFSVQGISDAGNVGTTSASTGCVYSWAPPQVGALHLSASVPAQTSLGDTTTSTFTLDAGKDPVAATGGVGAQISFQLLAGNRVIQTKGPGTALSATFDGISAGTSYSGKAIIAPPRHPQAAVTVGPVSVSTRSSWPGLSITEAKVTAGKDPRRGTLTVDVGGLASSAASGERFNLTSDSAFSCGNTSLPLSTSGPIDPAHDTITADVDLLQYYGDCSVLVRLVEDPDSATDPPVFGGTASPQVTSSVGMPGIPSGGLDPSAFAAAWDSNPNNHHRSTVTITVKTNDPSLLFVVAWDESIADGTSAKCGSAADGPPTTIEVDQRCVDDKGGDQNAWTAVIKYRSLGSPDVKSATVQVTGSPPTYTPPSPPPTPTPTSTSPSPTGSPTPSPT